MTDFSDNYQFELPNFNVATWHDAVNQNFRSLDALIFALTGFSNFQGPWENATLYAAGDRVSDSTDSSVWQCLVGNTSSSTLTFAADRAAHPTYWSIVSVIPNNRGAWAQNTAYATGDVAYQASTGLMGVAAVNHTSTAVGTMRTDIANWGILFDGTIAAGSAANVITFTPTGGIAATNVQTAVAEVDTEAAKKAANLSDMVTPATAFSNIKQAASDTASGAVELATDAEVLTGTDTVRAVTPANLTAVYPKRALLTTRGDIYRRGATDIERVGLGTSKQALVSDGSDAVWGDLAEVILTSGTISAQASLPIVLTTYIALGFVNFRLRVKALRTATDNVSLYFVTSTDGGSNYAGGASDYKWSRFGVETTTGYVDDDDDADAQIILASGMSNTAAEACHLDLQIFDVLQTTTWKFVRWNMEMIEQVGQFRMFHGGGVRQATADIDAIKIVASSGNLTSGSWVLTGWKGA